MNNLLLYAATVAIWGSTWLAINFQLGSIAPVVSLTYRFALAAAILMVFCVLRGRCLRFGPRAHAAFFLIGFVLGFDTL